MSPNKTAQSELQRELIKSLRDLIVSKNLKDPKEASRIRKVINSVEKTKLTEKDSAIVFNLIYLIVIECPNIVKPPYDKFLHSLAKKIEKKLALNAELKAKIKHK